MAKKRNSIAVDDAIFHLGVEYVVTDVKGKGVTGETPGATEAIEASKAELHAVRDDLAAKLDDLTPREVRAIEERIREWPRPDVGKFGCRKALLKFSNDRNAWVVPGQEEGSA